MNGYKQFTLDCIYATLWWLKSNEKKKRAKQRTVKATQTALVLEQFMFSYQSSTFSPLNVTWLLHCLRQKKKKNLLPSTNFHKSACSETYCLRLSLHAARCLLRWTPKWFLHLGHWGMQHGRDADYILQASSCSLRQFIPKLLSYLTEKVEGVKRQNQSWAFSPHMYLKCKRAEKIIPFISNI